METDVCVEEGKKLVKEQVMRLAKSDQFTEEPEIVEDVVIEDLDLTGTQFSNTTFINVVFDGCILDKFNCHNCTFISSRITRCKIKNSSIIDTIFSDVLIDDSTITYVELINTTPEVRIINTPIIDLDIKYSDKESDIAISRGI